VVPGGFGHRGIEGKIEAIRYCREKGVPFLGLCLGMQCAVIEFARDVAGLKGADSSEFDPSTPHAVIDLMPEQEGVSQMGGTMRLGKYEAALAAGSHAQAEYGRPRVEERHRHRYEFNNAYRDVFQERGMRVTGLYEARDLVEIVELPDHPWFVGVQFHPELKSRPSDPHPLFRGFIRAANEERHRREAGAPARPGQESASGAPRP
jgi:CTP synthase